MTQTTRGQSLILIRARVKCTTAGCFKLQLPLETKTSETLLIAASLTIFRKTNFQKQGYSHEKQTAFNFS